MLHALAHCIGGSLKPGGVIGSLFSRQYIDKRGTEMAEMIGVFDVLVQ